jgi:hypothetical protein
VEESGLTDASFQSMSSCFLDRLFGYLPKQRCVRELEQDAESRAEQIWRKCGVMAPDLIEPDSPTLPPPGLNDSPISSTVHAQNCGVQISTLPSPFFVYLDQYVRVHVCGTSG